MYTASWNVSTWSPKLTQPTTCIYTPANEHYTPGRNSLANSSRPTASSYNIDLIYANYGGNNSQRHLRMELEHHQYMAFVSAGQEGMSAPTGTQDFELVAMRKSWGLLNYWEAVLPQTHPENHIWSQHWFNAFQILHQPGTFQQEGAQMASCEPCPGETQVLLSYSPMTSDDCCYMCAWLLPWATARCSLSR